MAAPNQIAEFQRVGKEAYDDLWKVTANNWSGNDQVGNGWEFCENRDGARMYRRPVSKTNWNDAGEVQMGVILLENVTLEELVDMVTDISKRKLWDQTNLDYHEMLKVDDQNSIMYTAAKGFGPVSARDFVSVCHTERSITGDLANDFFASAQCSVEYGPENKAYVRGKILPTGWLFKRDPTNANNVRVTYIAGVVLGGWLPTGLINKAVYSNTAAFFPWVIEYYRNLKSQPNYQPPQLAM
eukprot:TRINITY_DN1433_c0_g1_i1.p1 TRINITY_DN1433_c0_g1~~TRINITY_DN1433_c0_g1_i1.p1  ORF type:complete len:265 (-),score=54.30 TRINITY_DN1433_c0_g1_i1:61-783(-)